VRGRVRRLGAQHLIAQQISTHKLYRRPVRESDRGVSLSRRMRDAGTEPCAVPFKTRAIKIHAARCEAGAAGWPKNRSQLQSPCAFAVK
jgi:hypothetical protein